MNKIRTYFTAFVLITFVVYWASVLISRELKVYRLKSNSKVVKALVFDERNYMGNSPVSQEYSYSYKFEVSGKIYTGDTNDPKFKLNDTILIKYLKDKPEINEPVEMQLADIIK